MHFLAAAYLFVFERIRINLRISLIFGGFRGLLKILLRLQNRWTHYRAKSQVCDEIGRKTAIRNSADQEASKAVVRPTPVTKKLARMHAATGKTKKL